MPKALICENDPDLQKNLSLIFKTLNIESILPLSLEEAINNLELEDIDIIVVNEKFANEKPQENRIIQWINSLPMYRRRDIMLIITGENLKSADRLIAFAKGADLVVNSKELNNFQAYFKRAYLEYQSKYKTYKDLLNK